MLMTYDQGEVSVMCVGQRVGEWGEVARASGKIIKEKIDFTQRLSERL